MNWRVFTLFLGIVLCISEGLFAQGFVDNALLFSRTRPGGSARIQALGGAQIALGGDFSSALSNPAGLGMYNRSEFTFSPAINFYTSDSEHLGTKENDSKRLLTIPGISYVHHAPQSKGGFLGGSFGISMTRTNDFNSKIQYSGIDDLSSRIDYFLENAYGFSIDPLPAPDDNIPLLDFDSHSGLAYWTFLINPFNEDPNNTNPTMPDDYINYYSELYPLIGEIRTLTRDETINTKGAQYQWSIAYGGNYKDKLFFGANVGISTLRYKYKSNYRESNFSFDLDPDYKPLDYFEMMETIDIEGSGVNLTLGLIYRAADFVQIGVSFVTPTYYKITDTYTATINALWNDSRESITSSISEPLISEYNFTTPLKFSMGTAFFISDYGFISGDVEFINYQNASYDSDISGISFDRENEDIKSFFKNTVNYRIGGEFKYDALRLRVGYNVQGNPINPDFDADQSIKTLSAGVGFRIQRFFTDLTWLSTRADTSYSTYVFQDGFGPIVDLKNKINTFILTFGLSF